MASLAEPEGDKNFLMMLVENTGCGSHVQPYNSGYFGMSFQEFVDGFDVFNNDAILWSMSSSRLINGATKSINDKEEYDYITSTFCRQKAPHTAFFMISAISSSPKEVQRAILLVFIVLYQS